MHYLWSWISSVCRQKRILILLCTFGSSFLAFNYSLLSSSSSTPSLTSFTTINKIDDDDSFGRILPQQRYQELDDNIQKSPGNQSSKLPYEEVAVSSSSSTSSSSSSSILALSSVAKNDNVSSSPYNQQGISAVRNQFNVSASHFISQSTAPLPISKHAQNAFTLQQRKASSSSSNQLIAKIGDHTRQLTNRNNSSFKTRRVNFLSAIEQKDDNNHHNKNNTLMSSSFQEANNNNSFHFSKGISDTPKDIDNNNNNNVKTDEIKQPAVASSSSSSSSIALLEIVEESIIVSGSNKAVSSSAADSPIFSNSIEPSSSSARLGLLSPVTALPPPPESSSSSTQPQEQLTSFYPTSRSISSGSGSSNSSGTSNNNKNNNDPFHSALPISSSTSSLPKSNLPTPFHIPPCNTTFQLRRIQKRKKNLTVIENFIMGWMHVQCNESITYTTHGDFRYLDNLLPLVERWKGPVSLALYCPGDDLDESLKLISYLKLCTSSNIDKWVTFHLIYDTRYVKRPEKKYTKHGDIPWLDAAYQEGKWKDCSQKPTFSKGNYTFRIKNGLLYPINIARNIARAAATTYFVLASDIELYPSINLIPSFMEMLGRLQKEEEAKNNYYNFNRNKFTAAAAAVVAKFFFTGSYSESSSRATNSTTDGGGRDEILEQRLDVPASKQHHKNEMQGRLSDLPGQQSRHVFVLPVFEVKKDIVPCQVETKEQLASLLKHRAAVLFHHSICPQCHTFPKYDEWKMWYPRTSDGAMIDYRTYNCTSNTNNLNNNNNGSNNETLEPPPSPTPFMMRIFHKAKRKRPYQLWEPIFIGTKYEPIYDERLSWEGLRDKMVSGYVMCALDYDFYILDNAFLVHKPGIRRVNHLVTKTVMSQDRLINYRIRSELLKKFGKHDECAL